MVVENLFYRWWFLPSIFGIFTSKIAEDEPNLTSAYFSDGLVQPPTSFFGWGRYPLFAEPPLEILEYESQFFDEVSITPIYRLFRPF